MRYKIKPVATNGRLFPYFGAKFRTAWRYGSPEYPRIIEPFCGAAGYALYWTQNGWRGDVLLNDLDPDIAAIWEFMIDARDDDIASLPEIFIEKEIPPGTPRGALMLMKTWANGWASGTNLWNGNRNFDQEWHEKKLHGFRQGKSGMIWIGSMLRPRLQSIAKLIKNWKITCLSYEDIENQEAHWFVDPPYQSGLNDKSIRINYSKWPSDMDFFHQLGKWCNDRHGALTVCEGAGATWLPFEEIGQEQSSWRNPRPMMIFEGGRSRQRGLFD